MRQNLRKTVTSILLLLVSSSPIEAQVPLEDGLQQVATELAASLTNSDLRKIAVVEFRDINGYPSALGPFIVEELITQLFQVQPGHFEIVERGQLDRILEEQKLTSSGLFDEDTIAEIGKILGLQAIITGSIADLGNSVRINARAIAVDSARIFAAASTTLEKDKTVTALLHQAATPTANPTRKSQPIGQPADVYFQNDFLRVTPVSLGVSTEERKNDISASATLSLIFENLSSSELRLGSLYRYQDCTLKLIDEKGSFYEVESSGNVAGIDCIHPSRAEASDYSSISPGSRTTVVMRFQGYVKEVGDVYSFAGDLVRLVDGKPQNFSVGINGIKRHQP